METKQIGIHLIIYSKYKYNNFPELNNYITKNNSFIKLLEKLKKPTIIVLGGDGTMLKSINKYHNKGYNFLGINFGNKGFLLNNKDFISEFSLFEEISYNLMECNIDSEKVSKVGSFFNEVNITSGNGNMLDLDITLLNNQKLSIMGDGIIVSTSAGSTGYNSSLGGPIIPHSIDALVLTPKAPWKPKGQHSIVLKGNEKIIITTSSRYNNFEVYLDGNDYFINKNNGTKVTIQKSSKKIKLLVDSKYKKIWDNKVLIEQGFKG